MYTIRLALVLAAAVLAGCGGGGGAGGGSNGGNQTVVVPVSLYGDSTQYGWTGGASPAQSAREALTGRAVIANLGVSGNNARKMLDGTDGLNKAWSQEMATTNAQIVTVKVLLNDGAYTAAEYKLYLEQIVDIARQHKKFIMLETPSPIDGVAMGPVWTSSYDARLSAMRAVADQKAVYLCVHPAVPMADALHPTNDGYLLVGKNLAKCLSDVL